MLFPCLLPMGLSLGEIVEDDGGGGVDGSDGISKSWDVKLMFGWTASASASASASAFGDSESCWVNPSSSTLTCPFTSAPLLKFITVLTCTLGSCQ